jgi:hypothetical protein
MCDEKGGITMPSLWGIRELRPFEVAVAALSMLVALLTL